MSDSILDEFADSLPQRTYAPRNRPLVRRTCRGRTRDGSLCHRPGLIVRGGLSYCWDHDPGKEGE